MCRQKVKKMWKLDKRYDTMHLFEIYAHPKSHIRMNSKDDAVNNFT